MVNKPSVVWNKKAEEDLGKAYKRIKRDSVQNAEKVRDGIIRATRELSSHPEKYPLDRFKWNNPGNFRAFEKYSYRIVYRYSQSEIRILRIRHVKQEPLNY